MKMGHLSHGQTCTVLSVWNDVVNYFELLDSKWMRFITSGWWRSFNGWWCEITRGFYSKLSCVSLGSYAVRLCISNMCCCRLLCCLKIFYKFLVRIFLFISILPILLKFIQWYVSKSISKQRVTTWRVSPFKELRFLIEKAYENLQKKETCKALCKPLDDGTCKKPCISSDWRLTSRQRTACWISWALRLWF